MDKNDYFDNVASEWDRMRKQFFSDDVRKKALDVAGVKSEQLAADVGAGTGFITEVLLGRGLNVIAIDQSDVMLEQMSTKFGVRPDLQCRLGTADNLPVDNSAVDYVFANMFLHHVGDPLQAIREMVRILKPGGMLVITDIDEHNHAFLKEEQHDRWMGFKRTDVHLWFEQVNLYGIKVDCIGEDCCATSSEGERAAISIFVASGRK